MRIVIPIVMCLSCLLVVACTDLTTLRSAHPIAPVRAYEALMVGNLEADYIGDESCLKSCHTHDQIAKDFSHSVHGDQISEDTGLPLVNCESCHGPGSMAVAGLTEKSTCKFDTLLQLKELPAEAKSLLCLKCHSAASDPVLHNWAGSTHANSGISCFDCHELHKGSQQKVARHEQDQICFKCHQDIRMEYSQFSHHPLNQKVMCTDCHNPHGTTQDKSLLGNTVKDTCTRCHMEYQGPFVYEHADVTEDCINCHESHGSPNDGLLQVSEPFLCMQCHSGHFGEQSPQGSLDNSSMKQAFYSRCTDCHSAIHGTDIPSSHGRGTFIAR